MPVVMTHDDAIIRYRLRLARTGIRVRTDEDEELRRNTFWAALQQFEELLDAAGTVGPASRPLPLFYALSQAGRAITAVHGLVPWKLHGHGLKLSEDTSQRLLERTVKPQPHRVRQNKVRDDSFYRVAKTIGSDVLTGPVELGAVWASLAYDLPRVWVDKWPPPLKLDLRVERLLPGSPPWNEAPAYVMGFTSRQVRAIREALEQYPTAQGWYVPGGGPPVVEGPVPGYLGYDDSRVDLAWTADGRSVEDKRAKLAEVAPAYRRRGQHLLRPAVGSQRDYLKPLAAWWILLYGLSMVARYEPAPWADVLAVNRSDLAAPLESLLDNAMLDIPQLVLEALDGQAFLVS
jgi:hypothetical protein